MTGLAVYPSVEMLAADERAVRAALRAFFGLGERWQLTADEQRRLLGSPAASTMFQWKRDGTRGLAPDTLLRVSYLLGIYAALRRLFAGAPERADRWMRQPNAGPLTQGRSALEYVLEGGPVALHELRMFLEAEAGGGPATALETAPGAFE